MTNKHNKCEPGRGMSVAVRGDDIEKAFKVFKKKVLMEGLVKEMRARQAYEKPSERKKRKLAEAKRREKKARSLRVKQMGY